MVQRKKTKQIINEYEKILKNELLNANTHFSIDEK